MSRSEARTAVLALASKHGLDLAPASITFNDIGLDFRVAFGRATDGVDWVLRMPRRPDVVKKSRGEAKILSLVKGHLPVAVPDWRVHTDELIAYPLLPGKPGMTVTQETHEVTWHFDPQSRTYSRSLAKVMIALHGVGPTEAKASGVTVLTSAEVRERHLETMDKVRRELGVADDLWARWQAWLADDSFWPTDTRLVHTELYPAHVIIDDDAEITGVIDWTEAVVGDPAADFALHLLAFGDEGFDRLVEDYQKLGGRTWPRLKEHCQECLAAGPVNYALYALTTGDQRHLQTARIQLGVATDE